MRKTVSGASETAVVLTCADCGREIVLWATEIGAEIRDAPQFVRVHASCLSRVLAGKPAPELPD